VARLVAVLALLLCGACEQSGDDGACTDGEAECPSPYEIRYCLDGAWGEPQECPPVNSGEFEVSTVCDDGLCRP